MKSYVVNLGGMEVLIHNNRGYALENGEIKNFFNSVPVLAGDNEIALKNNFLVKTFEETEAFNIYFTGFWGGTKVRNLLLECFNKKYTVEEASEIIGNAYSRPIEEEVKSVKDFIKRHTGKDWK